MSHQAIAAQKFLPFCRALLQGGLPARTEGPLPLRTPGAVTAEVMLAVEDMINKAVMGWLIRGIGWRRCEIPDEEEVFTARIWDEDIWGDLRLDFSTASVDLLLMVFNQLSEQKATVPSHPNNRRWKRMSAQQRRVWTDNARRQAQASLKKTKKAAFSSLKLNSTGDLLLHHVVFRAVYRRKAMAPMQWMSNPLNAMALSLIHI